MSKRIVIGGVLLVAVLLVPLWLARAPVSEVRVAEVRRAPLVIEVATNGLVEPIDDFEVRARLDGRITEIRAAGTQVRQGDALLRIDPAPVAAALKSARSQQLEAQESLRAARDHLSRIERTFALDDKLHNESALASERFVESQATLNEARARVAFLEQEVPLRVESLELKIHDLEDQLGGTEVLAPSAGTVYRAQADVGEVVRRGQLILAVADLERLQIRMNVDQVDLGKVRPGNPVKVFANAFPEETWHGETTEVVPRVEMRDNRAVSEAVAEIEPPARGLVPGMNVDVDIVVGTRSDVLQVPSEAIFAAGQGPFVYRVVDDRVEARSVDLGLSSFSAVEVRAGLTAGDEVVLGPASSLADGMRVAPQRGSDGRE